MIVGPIWFSITLTLSSIAYFKITVRVEAAYPPLNESSPELRSSGT